MGTLLTSCANTSYRNADNQHCAVEFVILGIGQDGGAPQIDRHNDPAWQDNNLRLYAASGALVDHRDGSRYLFEATPDMREQLYTLEAVVGEAISEQPLGLAGVFLTHAHIGHYAGLMFVGHESAGASGLRVYAMPRMRRFLETNGPWDQLVRYNNISIVPIENGESTQLRTDLAVIPLQVPHRDEYSETVAYLIQGPSKRVLFLPDIDDWDRWEDEFDTRIEKLIASVDVAFLDATFFDDNELPGRDMSQIPHPRLADSMQRFMALPENEREKIRFFHLNHTNQARYATSQQRRRINASGYRLAERRERVCLD